MKILLTLLFSLAGIVSVTGQQPISRNLHKHRESQLKTGSRTDLPRKIDCFNWNENDWIAEKTVTVAYNASGYPVTKVWNFIAGTNKKYSYKYTGNNLRTEELEQILENNLWVNSARERREYNSHDYNTLYVRENFINGAWMIQYGYQSLVEYDGDLVHIETSLTFDPSDGLFHPDFRYTLTYDNGIMVSDLEEIYIDGEWKINSRAFYFYGDEGQNDYTMIENWNGTAWVASYKQAYTFTGGDNVIIIEYLWDTVGQVFNPTNRYVEECDSHHALTLYSWETWNAGVWTVMDGGRFTITYSGEHAVTRISEFFIVDPANSIGQWQKISKEDFSDFENLGTNPLIAEPLSLSIYPNPAVDHVVISYNLISAAGGNVSLYNGKGDFILQKEIADSYGSVMVDLRNLSAGIYFIRINSGLGNSITRKFIRK